MIGLLLAFVVAASLPQEGWNSARAAGETVKIGVDLPMSGGDASNGIPTNQGVILAVDEANAKGGPVKFQAYTLDDAVQGTHDPAQGAQNIKTFISDSAVLGVVGPFNSNVAQAEIPLGNDAGLVIISPSNTNDGLTIGENAKKLRASHPDENAYFRVCTRDQNQGKAGAQLAKSLGLKRVYVVDDNETYGKGLADVFESAFKSDGGTILGHDHLTKNQQDFKALLNRIKATKPDGIYFGGVTVSGGGLLRRQMADAGMGSVPFVGGDGISDEEFIKVAGSMANGAYYTVAAPDTAKLASAKAFIAAYKAKFKSDPGPYSANAYAAALVIIDAVNKAAKSSGKMPTRAEVLKNVQATKDIQTPIGTVGFDKNGDTTNGVLSFYKIQGG
ncbi:MAG: branched-chain amino acid ABC transporter substrate-binding protein, partial [Candidatus Eremiobacteraeota bacterium]|nr:branched-chain amino acid ABC transporter substrate-binding protein [Candidatus Eremiobacteraeota bacterium]